MRNKLFAEALHLLRKFSVKLLMFCSFIGANALAASPVTELKANEVLGFAAKHRNAVVQFTSSDPKCGYCIGADKAFDLVASKTYSQPVMFARVVWPAPWNKMPEFPAEFNVYGAPWHLTFRAGKRAGGLDGMPKDLEEMVQAVETFVSRELNSAGSLIIPSVSAVKDVRVDDLAVFVKAHNKSIVQFLSSDLLCKFCNGAETGFNQLALKNTDKSLTYARVQWPFPWRKIPDMGALTKIEGLPMQVVFVNGRSIGSFDGKYIDTVKLDQGFKAIFVNNSSQTTSNTGLQPSQQDAVVLNNNEQSILRLHLRHEFFQKVESYCSKQFPAQAAESSKLLSAWKASNQSKLDEAAALMLKRASQGADIDFAGLASLEKAQTKAWQVTKLGIPDNRAPQVDECAKMMGNLTKVD